MPLKDSVGMGLAVEMVDLSLVANGRFNKDDSIQYNTMRKPRATYSKLWESSPMGIAEGSSFSKGMNKSTLTSCPPQSDTLLLFSIGAETRMGSESAADKTLHILPVIIECWI